MEDRNRLYVTEGIVLRRMPLRETSILLDVLTTNLGMIPVVAKGARSTGSKLVGLLEPNNRLEITLYKTQDAKWWYFRSGSFMRNYHADPVTNTCIQAAFEVILQIMIDESDSDVFFELLCRFLDYVVEHPKNSVAVFWRFMLAVLRFMGIPLNLEQCVLCDREGIQASAYYPRQHGMVCDSCRKPVMEDYLVHVDVDTAQLLGRLPVIGNYLDDLTIPVHVFRTVNRILRLHIEENMHRQFNLKSLEILEKLIYV